MRGSSSGGIPAPVSATVSTASPPSSAGSHLDPAPGRRVLDRVVQEVRHHLAHPVAVGGDAHARARHRLSRRDALLLGHVGVEAHGVAHDVGQLEALAAAAASRRPPPPRCPSACRASPPRAPPPRGSRPAPRADRARPGPARSAGLGRRPQPHHRRAQVVGDVVQRAAHGRDQGLDAVEQRVDLRAELVERVRRVAHGHARAQASGLQDVADGAAQVAQRLQGGAREDVAAAGGDERR